MSQRQPSPAEEIAGTVNELAAETRRLVHDEAKAAEEEVVSKARASAPVIALFAAAGLLALLAGASLYRFAMRLLERLLPPTLAALAATGAAGAGALALVRAGSKRLGEIEPPVPTDTVHRATKQARAVAERVG